MPPRSSGPLSKTCAVGASGERWLPVSMKQWLLWWPMSAARLSRETGIEQVALSGGVFQNVLLVRLVCAELNRRQLRPLVHRVVPPNDGGLALGQAAIAALRCLLRPDREAAR